MRLQVFLSCLLAVGTNALVSKDANAQEVQEALKLMNIDITASSLEVPAATTLETVVGSAPTAQADVKVAADAAADPAYWYKDIKKQGIAAFNANPSGYKVFRNVMDYGAKGNHMST